MSGRATIGFVADDLTGAADVLAQAYAEGLDAALVLDAAHPLPDDVDVVGIAGPLRSLDATALHAEATRGFAALAERELRVVLDKVCSTFDSSPTIGSIGASIDAMRATWPGRGAVPVVPAQPEFGRHTAFSQHFGRHAGAVHRLDRHPVMATHPSTPMREADLRLVLQEQLPGSPVVPGLHLPELESAERLRDAWATLAASDAPAVVVDAVTPAHMDAIAQRLLDDADRGPAPALVVGSGGIMAALARALHRETRVAPATTAPSGPVLVVSASASSTTAAQLDDALAAGFVEVAIPAEAFGDAASEANADWSRAVEAALSAGRHVVAHTARGGDDARLRASTASAADVGGLIGRLAGRMVRAGRTRDLAICGGDTSSHALVALGAREVRVDELFVLVGPICRTDDASDAAGCRVLLKGGQVGPTDVLRRFAGLTPGEHA
ncbi:MULTISPECIES: four-carbon acid sugar kinase family protein [unclassified Agrococcus]|uniref:four-carbon acid sugar kinase family protein n=1 Tax=unclassified Agrococcus TaxID=2615065 RepID=UPI00360C6185